MCAAMQGCSRATVLLVAVVWAVLLAAPVHAGVNGSPDSIEFMSLAVHTPLNTPKLDTSSDGFDWGLLASAAVLLSANEMQVPCDDTFAMAEPAPTAVCFVGTCAGAFYTYIVLRTAPGVQPVFIGKGWMSCSPLAAAPRLLALPPSLPPSRLIPHSHTFLR